MFYICYRSFATEFCSILKTSHWGGGDSTAEPLVPGEGITPLRPLDNWIFLLLTNFNRLLVLTIYELDFPFVN